MKTIFVSGPATQDCLKQTVLEACNLGLQVVVLQDAIGSTDHIADSLKEIYSSGVFQATASSLNINM